MIHPIYKGLFLWKCILWRHGHDNITNNDIKENDNDNSKYENHW